MRWREKLTCKVTLPNVSPFSVHVTAGVKEQRPSGNEPTAAAKGRAPAAAATHHERSELHRKATLSGDSDADCASNRAPPLTGVVAPAVSVHALPRTSRKETLAVATLGSLDARRARWKSCPSIAPLDEPVSRGSRGLPAQSH
jgi:hypothetical protein